MSMYLYFWSWLILYGGCVHAAEPMPKKPWTILFYGAEVNHLSTSYAIWNSIRQLAQCGSNDSCNILVQMHERSEKKTGTIWYIEPMKARIAWQPGQMLNSGSAETLINFCTYCLQQYPSEKIALIISGVSGAYTPFSEQGCGCIAYDERYNSWMNDETFKRALQQITDFYGRKIDILGFDSDSMACIEWATLCAPYAEYMIACQGKVSAHGWDYKSIIPFFSDKNSSSARITALIVDANARLYHPFPQRYYDFAAYNLQPMGELSDVVSQIAQLCIQILQKQKKSFLSKVLYAINTKSQSRFAEKQMIDLGYFLRTLCSKIETLALPTVVVHEQLKSLLQEGIRLLRKMIIAQKSNRKIISTNGMSIYFPHQLSLLKAPYYCSEFSQSNKWPYFLKVYEALLK